MNRPALEPALDFNQWLTTIPGIPADWGRAGQAAGGPQQRPGGQASLLRRNRGLPRIA